MGSTPLSPASSHQRNLRETISFQTSASITKFSLLNQTLVRLRLNSPTSGTQITLELTPLITLATTMLLSNSMSNLTQSVIHLDATSTSIRRRTQAMIRTTQSLILVLTETSLVLTKILPSLKVNLSTSSSWEPMSLRPNGRTQPKRPTTITHQSSIRICMMLPPTSTSSKASLVTSMSHGPSFKPRPHLTQSVTPAAATSISTRRRTQVMTRTTQLLILVSIEISLVPTRTSPLPKVCSSISSSWELMNPKPNGRTQLRRPTTTTLQSSTETCTTLLPTLTSLKVNSVTNTSHGLSFKLKPILCLTQSAPPLAATSISTQRRMMVMTRTTQSLILVSTEISLLTTRTFQSPKRSSVTTGTGSSRNHH